VTNREWLTSRVPPAPPRLLDQILRALGSAADAPADPSNMLQAAGRVAGEVQRPPRQTRDDALDVLAADALVTFAFELGAERGDSLEGLGARAFDTLASASRR
jgi:hypothetical protein